MMSAQLELTLNNPVLVPPTIPSPNQLSMLLAALVLAAAFVWQATCALEIFSPASISGTVPHETASFGPAASSYSVSGALVLADPENACNPLRWTNASAPSPYAGALVMGMRGNCSFAAKVLFIQVGSTYFLGFGNMIPYSIFLTPDS